MSFFQKVLSLAFLTFPVLVFFLPCVASHGCRNPVIFNFGDSNSDTGGFAAAMGYEFGYPYGRSFFHRSTGRLSDGRLVIDFLCENLKTNYLTPYLESLGPDFTNGANFAAGGATTLPRNVPFNLNVQLLQFTRFHNHSLQLHSKGLKKVIRDKDFRKALYTIDIGQFDLWVALNSFSYAEAIEKIPSFISEIRDAILAIYRLGGRKFWIHNTGPLGCLPAELATRKTNVTDLDQYGCIKSLNEGAKAFNAKLNHLCQELRIQINDSTVVYVDIYSIKYNLIANSTHYGFENPLTVCCGYGGAPYNFDHYIKCRDIIKGANLCEQRSPRINWDGTHYSEPANAFVASEILSTKYSTPRLKFNFFCNKSLNILQPSY
ncbi:hypothetical protein ABFS82_04G004000 [Erythranthe guttata]|nr:PREDICTED: GDSL esterase/lipase LIP-4-like [Erythranthe guttata]|eukprot:XP_012836390.1 PREDICTED: GDSL esterase/lipase LIP-4-like [Erythranthe guttata]